MAVWQVSLLSSFLLSSFPPFFLIFSSLPPKFLLSFLLPSFFSSLFLFVSFCFFLSFFLSPFLSSIQSSSFLLPLKYFHLSSFPCLLFLSFSVPSFFIPLPLPVLLSSFLPSLLPICLPFLLSSFHSLTLSSFLFFFFLPLSKKPFSFSSAYFSYCKKRQSVLKYSFFFLPLNPSTVAPILHLSALSLLWLQD